MNIIETLEWSTNRMKGLIFVGLALGGLCFLREEHLNLQENKGLEMAQIKTPMKPIKYLKNVENQYTQTEQISEFEIIDINHADSTSIESLPGIGPKITSRILKCRKKFGGFKNWEDLQKVYGMEKVSDKIKNRISFGDFKENTTSNLNHSTEYQKDTIQLKTESTTKKCYQKNLVLLNSADSTSLESLPGIGSKMASRIIKFRDRMGGFYSIDQIKEVYGITDENFAKFSNRIIIDSGVNKINLQTVSLEKLANHPYCGWKNAKLIIAYRDQHQHISWSEIEQMPVLDQKMMYKLKFYLTNI